MTKLFVPQRPHFSFKQRYKSHHTLFLYSRIPVTENKVKSPAQRPQFLFGLTKFIKFNIIKSC